MPTDTELIEELQRLADSLDKTPTFDKMNTHGKYSSPTYVNRFGSWNAAIEKAGLDINTPQEYSDQELLTHLQNLADELDKTPSSKDMNEHGDHHTETYRQRFDSWNNALEEAGLEKNRDDPRKGTVEERKQHLLDELAELTEDLGRVPTQKEVRKYTNHSHNTYYKHFGSIKQAVEQTDLDLDTIDTSRKTHPRSITNDELLEELRRLADELDRPPKVNDIKTKGKYSYTPYRDRFDSHDDALRQAGLTA